MQKTEAQHNHAQSRPVQRQGGVAALESPQGERIAQLEAMAESSPQAGKLAQLAAMIDASPAMAAQRRLVGQVHGSPAMAAQRKAVNGIAQRAETPAKPNNTGLPDNLKSGIESLSGMAMDNVKVHYNSSQPAQLNALAYAQGTDIHVAPGQEQHLPHEAWHVVQQAQGRVRPTMQMKESVQVNDDAGLEHEADVMGARAVQMRGGMRDSRFPLQLKAGNHIYQFNGKETAAIAGLAFAGGALLTWLWNKWDEKTAKQKQQAIVNEFERAMNVDAFRTHKENRENIFVLAALKEGVPENVARSLFKESGGAAKDTVTGFDLAADRKPTIQNAINYIKDNKESRGFYVEVDIRNLGGLNSVLGHTGADGVFAKLAELTGASVKALEGGPVKVAMFRHGGDEFSFVVFSSDSSVTKSNVETKLESANLTIQNYVSTTKIIDVSPDAKVEKEATLNNIEHPKHKGDEKYFGTGIVFGVSQILGTDSVDKVTSAADNEVETKKK